ncbi:hypothetical protein X943_001102 [Babesia divergens]|uniref:Uncharacterized protein n=1 Tax=Babesia divergens TaxID=32595 RepID=A0AAD9G6R2_BABDI|nr:hypothetical protein X943_001102 [Babesia divergens]
MLSLCPTWKASHIRHCSRYFSGYTEASVKPRHVPEETARNSSEPVYNYASNRTLGPEADEACDIIEACLPHAARKSKLVHHVFRWGVGNAFRSHSKNRFKPTHSERNTAASIPEEYFSCSREFDHCKIAYDGLNEQWEVLWNEFGKVNGKPFPVKKFGIDAAKAESIAFAEELNKRLSSKVSTELEPSKEAGLTFDHTLHCWVALGRVGNRPAARAFSAEYHGYENARRMATDFKNT